MTMRFGFDWIDQPDGTFEIYTTDRKIAHIAQNADGQWHVASDPDHTFADVRELLRLIDNGKRDGFAPQGW